MRFHPSYHLVGASPLPLDVEYLFLAGSNILLLMVVEQRIAILEFLEEKISALYHLIVVWPIVCKETCSILPRQ